METHILKVEAVSYVTHNVLRIVIEEPLSPSKLFMLEIKSTTRQVINIIGQQLYGESSLYILKGNIESDGNVYQSKQLLVAKESSLCQFTIEANSILYIFGGESFAEQRLIDWNFVASRKELIDQAKQKWITQTLNKIKGDETEFIPYPSFIKK